MKIITTLLAWFKHLQTAYEQDTLAPEVNERTSKILLDDNE